MPAGEPLTRLLIQILLVCQSSKSSRMGEGKHGIREGGSLLFLSFKLPNQKEESGCSTLSAGLGGHQWL